MNATSLNRLLRLRTTAVRVIKNTPPVELIHAENEVEFSHLRCITEVTFICSYI